MMDVLRMIVIMLAIAAFNSLKPEPSPRYWQSAMPSDSLARRNSHRARFDSLFREAEHKADSVFNIPEYLKQMEQIKNELK